jgi:hypothetical protein
MFKEIKAVYTEKHKPVYTKCTHSFPFVSNLEHRAPFGVFVITHTYRHTVGLLWMSDQPVAEISTYTGQHNR